MPGWLDVTGNSLRYSSSAPQSGPSRLGQSRSAAPFAKSPQLTAPSPAKPQLQTGSAAGKPSFWGSVLNTGAAIGEQALSTAGNVGGIRGALGGAAMLGGRAALALPASTATTALDAVRTPFDLATGRDSLRDMHQRDMERINAYGQSTMGRIMGYNSAASTNMVRPVASTLALADSGIDAGLHGVRNWWRAPGLDRGLADVQQQRAATTQQAMASGTATRQQLQDAMVAAKQERARIDDSMPRLSNFWGL